MARLAALATVLLLAATPALADHVSVSLQVSARLGERVSDRSWSVVVDWSITCRGPQPGQGNYTGDLYLDDLDSGEALYMGGTAGASGSDSQPVAQRAAPRRMRPRIKASCFDGGPGNHGSDTLEVTGNEVLVPGRDDDSGQGTRDFPGSRFGGATDPLTDVACAGTKEGSDRSETLVGTPGSEVLYGLGGDDRIRGIGGDDCLVGGDGGDRLLGGSGNDRLTGGPGADTLVGGDGVNRYDGGPGADTVRARNGRRELVSCGSGRDVARVDRRDRVRGCERVRR
jgi:Ca2+-binding RTX toxin-like protein